MKNRLLILMSVLIAGSLLLSACGTGAVETVIVEIDGETVIQTVVVEVEKEAEAETRAVELAQDQGDLIMHHVYLEARWEYHVMAEDFIQWVLQDSSAAGMPDLAQSGVTVTADVDPYEETKIRVLNGGHTALCYMAALEGIETFDAVMRVPHLNAHFQNFETKEALPAITIDLPFSKEDYLADIARRFGNRAIGDTVARICADGMAKFPIFIRPTLAGCLQQGILPVYAIRSIASWYVFARHVAAGKIPFTYIEPSWNDLNALLGTEAFLTNPQLWGDLPETYPEFAETLGREIKELELKWPV